MFIVQRAPKIIISENLFGSLKFVFATESYLHLLQSYNTSNLVKETGNYRKYHIMTTLEAGWSKKLRICEIFEVVSKLTFGSELLTWKTCVVVAEKLAF